jgi:hypothetical protein
MPQKEFVDGSDDDTGNFLQFYFTPFPSDLSVSPEDFLRSVLNPVVVSTTNTPMNGISRRLEETI